MGYIRKSAKKAVVDGENKHPYMKGFVFWAQNRFWEDRDDMTEAGKEYFRDSLNRMSRVYQLPTVDQSLS